MKTFLGFTTGVFVGIIAGAFAFSLALASSKRLRNLANDIYDGVEE